MCLHFIEVDGSETYFLRVFLNQDRYLARITSLQNGCRTQTKIQQASSLQRQPLTSLESKTCKQITFALCTHKHTACMHVCMHVNSILLKINLKTCTSLELARQYLQLLIEFGYLPGQDDELMKLLFIELYHSCLCYLGNNSSGSQGTSSPTWR